MFSTVESSSNVNVHLVGDGRAGKSTVRIGLEDSLSERDFGTRASLSILRFFREALVPHQDSTLGLHCACVLSFKKRWIVLDYGGQDFQHVNHPFFLSKPNSIFIIVVPLWNHEERKEYEDAKLVERYRYWLKYINSFSHLDGSHIITMVNKFTYVFQSQDYWNGKTKAVDKAKRVVESLKEVQREWENEPCCRLSFHGDPICFNGQRYARVYSELNPSLEYLASMLPVVPKTGSAFLDDLVAKFSGMKQKVFQFEKFNEIVMESHTMASKEFQYGVCSHIIRTLASENQLIYIEDSLGRYRMSNSGITLNIRVSASVSSEILGKLHIGDGFEFDVVEICKVIDPKDPDLVHKRVRLSGLRGWVTHSTHNLASNDIETFLVHSSNDANDLVTENDEVTFNCWIVVDINWLTEKIVGNINNKLNDLKEAKQPQYTLSASQVNEFASGSKGDSPIADLFCGNESALPRMLHALGVCFRCDSEDVYFPTFYYLEKHSEEWKNRGVDDFSPSTRTIMRSFNLENDKFTILGQSYFSKLNVDLITALRPSRADQVQIFSDGSSIIRYGRYDGNVSCRVIIDVKDTNSSYDLHFKFCTNNVELNKHAWEEFEKIRNLIFDAGKRFNNISIVEKCVNSRQLADDDTFDHSRLHLLDPELSADELPFLYAKYFGHQGSEPANECANLFILFNDSEVLEGNRGIGSRRLFFEFDINSVERLQKCSRSEFYRYMTSIRFTLDDIRKVWNKLHPKDKRVRRLEDITARVDSTIERLERWIPGICERLRRLENTVPGVLQRLNNLEDRFPGIIDKLDEILVSVPLFSEGLDNSLKRIEALEALAPVRDAIEDRIFEIIQGNEILKKYNRCAESYLNAIFATSLVMETQEFAQNNTKVYSLLSAMSMLAPAYGNILTTAGEFYDSVQHDHLRADYHKILSALSSGGDHEQAGRMMKHIAAFFTIAYQKDLCLGVVRYNPTFSKRVEGVFSKLMKGGFFRKSSVKKGYLIIKEDEQIERLARDHISIAMECIKLKTQQKVEEFCRDDVEIGAPGTNFERIANTLLVEVFRVYPLNLDCSSLLDGDD